MRKKSQAASPPVSIDLLHELLDTLEERLSEEECDHSLRFTEDFLATSAEGEEALSWLLERGGVCDCEVQASLEDELRS